MRSFVPNVLVDTFQILSVWQTAVVLLVKSQRYPPSIICLCCERWCVCVCVCVCMKWEHMCIYVVWYYFQLSVCKYFQYDSRGLLLACIPAYPASVTYVLRASFLMLEINEFWCYEAKIEKSIYGGVWGLVVVRLSWLSGRALAAQARGVLRLIGTWFYEYH